MANQNKGTIECPIGTAEGVPCEGQVRRCVNKHGDETTWYWMCRHGKITPNMKPGQEFVMDHAKIFGAEGEPEEPDIDAEEAEEQEPVVEPGEDEVIETELGDDDGKDRQTEKTEPGDGDDGDDDGFLL